MRITLFPERFKQFLKMPAFDYFVYRCSPVLAKLNCKALLSACLSVETELMWYLSLLSVLLLAFLVCGPTSTTFDRAEVVLSSYSFHETQQQQRALGAPSWRVHQHPPKRDFRDSSRREKPLIRLKPYQMLENAATRPTSVGNQSSPVLPRTACLGFFNAPK